MAYYCLHKLHKWPESGDDVGFNRLPKKEKAFVMACILIKVEEDKKAEKKAKSK